VPAASANRYGGLTVNAGEATESSPVRASAPATVAMQLRRSKRPRERDTADPGLVNGENTWAEPDLAAGRWRARCLHRGV